MFRIRHKPTGLYFGQPDCSISKCIGYLRNIYIDINGLEFKRGTSGRGRGKIWTSKLYAERTLDQLKQVTNPEDWELKEY